MTSPHQVPGPSPKIFVGPPLRSLESFGQVPDSPSVPAHTSSDVMMIPATNKRAMHRELIWASPNTATKFAPRRSRCQREHEATLCSQHPYHKPLEYGVAPC